MALGQYLRDTKIELSHVSWPTRRQAAVFTMIVIGVSLAVSALLGSLDLAFNKILQFFL